MILYRPYLELLQSKIKYWQVFCLILKKEANITLHIGSMMLDRSLNESVLIEAITKVATDLDGLRDQLIQQKTPVMDIIFLLPGREEKADFTGLRLRPFDHAGQILRIESARMEKMVTSIHAERFVIAIMKVAIDVAGEFFREQHIHIQFNLTEHLALMDGLITKEQRAIN